MSRYSRASMAHARAIVAGGVDLASVQLLLNEALQQVNCGSELGVP